MAIGGPNRLIVLNSVETRSAAYLIPPERQRVITQRDGILVKHILRGAFNATRISHPQHSEVILARETTQKSPEPHGVDLSRLMVFDAVREEPYEFDIRKPDGVSNLEDPRSLVTEDGHIFIGLTAVFDRKPGKGIHYAPAIVEAEFDLDGRFVQKGSLQIFPQIEQGRNTLPMQMYEDGSLRFMTRIDDKPTSQTLHEYIAHPNGEAELLRIHDIPPVHWIGRRVGTVGLPLSLPDGTEVQFIHGQEERTLRGLWPVRKRKKQVEYTLGALQLIGGEIVGVTENPIVTRRHVPFGKELHGEKIVVYSTDNPRLSPDGKFVTLLVSSGDQDTAQVWIPVSLLKSKISVLS